MTAEPEHEFGGRVAIVTGGGANLGRAVALELGRRGAGVGVLVRSDRGRADEVAREIEAAGGRAMALVADVRDAPAVADQVEACRAALGPVTVLVHCAAQRSGGYIHEVDPDAWRATMAVVLDGAFHSARAVLPGMVAAGSGRIVFVGGSAMTSGLPAGHGPVAAAKAGLLGLARTIAQEYGCHGVTANIVSPGPIESPRTRSQPAALVQQLLADTPAGRLTTMDELVATIAFVLSSHAGMVTGQLLAVDGGLRGMNP